MQGKKKKDARLQQLYISACDADVSSAFLSSGYRARAAVWLRDIHLPCTWWCWCTMISPLSLLWQPCHLPSFHQKTISLPALPICSATNMYLPLLQKHKKEKQTVQSNVCDVMCKESEERVSARWSYSECVCVCVCAFVIFLMHFQDWESSGFFNVSMCTHINGGQSILHECVLNRVCLTWESARVCVRVCVVVFSAHS